jgi:hypothetical protein
MFKLSLRTSILLVTTFVVAFLLGHTGLVLKAQGAPSTIKVPVTWGSVKAATVPYIVFEDTSGTIRIFNLRGGAGSAELETTITRE